jgi:hypothetical protein
MTRTKADDVTTLDGIIGALYDSISGPAGVERDGRRFRSLFLEDGARLVRTNVAEDGSASVVVMGVDEYLRAANEYFQTNGFYEREIARRVERFGHVTHALSTYESRREESEAEPFARGVNSIQLFHDGRRYRVVTIFWDFERPDNPVPPEYLPGRA